MSTSVSDTLQSDIRSKLGIIRNNFLRKSGDGFILENCIIPNNTTFDFGNSALKNIINYTAFVSADASILQNYTVSANTIGNIKILKSEVYSGASTTDLNNLPVNLQLETKKINLTSFYTPDILNILNAIAENYNLLRDNWGTFKSGLRVSLKGYGIDSSTNKNVQVSNITTSSYANSALKTGFELDTVINDDSINLFAAQRMLLLMILITEIYTAMKLYEQNSANNDVYTALLNVMLNKINILLTINENSASSNTGIESSYTQAYQTYKNNQSSINDVKDRLETIRLDLSNNKAYLDSQTDISRKMNTLSYFAYAIGAVLFISIIVVLFVPFDQTKKRAALLILLLLVVLIGSVIYLIGRSIQTEGFVGSVTDINQLRGYNGTIGASDVVQKLIYPLILQQILVYLEDTIRLSNTVSSTQVYNNVNASLSREATYYKDTTGQLELGSTKAGDMSKVFYLDSTVARSRISLVIALLVIAAVSATLILVFDASSAIKKTIYIVAALFIFLSVLLYVLYTAPRVRTDAYKYYWGRPEKATL